MRRYVVFLGKDLRDWGLQIIVVLLEMHTNEGDQL